MRFPRKWRGSRHLRENPWSIRRDSCGHSCGNGLRDPLKQSRPMPTNADQSRPMPTIFASCSIGGVSISFICTLAGHHLQRHLLVAPLLLIDPTYSRGLYWVIWRSWPPVALLPCKLSCYSSPSRAAGSYFKESSWIDWWQLILLSLQFIAAVT